jgi:regulatory protein YycI of two-component signal transduction system YycFG
MLKKSLFTLSILIILLLIFGSAFVLGEKFASIKLQKAEKDTNQRTADCQLDYATIKKQLAEKNPFGAALLEMQTKTHYGTVEKIAENELTLKSARDPNLPNKLAPETRTAQITKDTKFYQLIQKDAVQFQKEQEDYLKKIQAQKDNATIPAQPITPPQFQEKKEVTFSDLKTGQLLQITADEDISDKKDFTAKEITIWNTY